MKVAIRNNLHSYSCPQVLDQNAKEWQLDLRDDFEIEK